MSEAAPGHVGDVEQAVHAIEIDERAEIGQVFHGAFDHVADLHAFEELLPLLAAFLFDQFAARKDDVLSVIVNFDDLEVVGVADELLQIFRRNNVDLRRGQKRFDADVDHQAAFHDRLHLALDQAVAGENAGDLVPILAISGLFFRENDHAFVVLETLEEHFDFVAHFERFDVIKFMRRDDAFGFVTNVHEHFARTNFEDATFNDATFFEIAI